MTIKLPIFDIPDYERPEVEPRVMERLIHENVRWLKESGRMQRLRADPTRCPVDARFVLRERDLKD